MFALNAAFTQEGSAVCANAACAACVAHHEFSYSHEYVQASV